MGKLVDGVWHDVWYDTAATKGRFERSKSQFRNFVTADGSAGPTARPASRPKRVATTSMSRSPVPGRTAP